MRYKFDMGGSYVFFCGETLGIAIHAFITLYSNRVKDITAITEYPVKEHELP